VERSSVPPVGATVPLPPPASEPVVVQPDPSAAAAGQPPRSAYSGVRYRLPPPRLYPIAPQRARPARPRRYGDAGAPFTIAVGGSRLWQQDDGYERLSQDESSGALELFASYDVWAPTRGLVIAAGASFRSQAYDSDDAYQLQHSTVQAELLARLVVTSWWMPHLRAAVGGVVTRFESRDASAVTEYEDRDAGVASTFGAGFTLSTPRRLFETRGGRLSSLAVGVLVEGGYTLAKAATLAAKPTESSEITRATFSLGKLERSAPYLRIMGVLRF
jgi:hypothetical protein